MSGTRNMTFAVLMPDHETKTIRSRNFLDDSGVIRHAYKLLDEHKALQVTATVESLTIIVVDPK